MQSQPPTHSIRGDAFYLLLTNSCLGPGRTSGQNCFCCDKISDKYLFPVKFTLLCLGSHAICIPVIHASMCTKENFPTPARSVSRYHAIQRQDAAFAFVGLLLLLTCMQARMANVYNLHCIYRLHNLNIQLALLEYERQIRQHRRTERWLTHRLLADQNNYLYLESSLLMAYKEH